MKKLFILLLVILCACDKNDNQQQLDLAQSDWNTMIENMAKRALTKCLESASAEFKNINAKDNEQTCACVIKYIYGDTEYANVDRFDIDFRAVLKNKCGKHIPSDILEQFPEK